MPKPPSERTSRLSISLPQSLLRDLDRMMHKSGHNNRSLAIAKMVRQSLVDYRQQQGNWRTAGTITLVYDHHKPHLQDALTRVQHDHHALIVSVLHVHLDHHNCLEVLVVRGRAKMLRKLAGELMAVKGVKHGKLTMTSEGKDLTA